MVSTHKSLCPRIKHGFTLIELMVATAIMAMLIMAVMGITSHVLSSWSSASGRLGANAEARIALQHLGDDLETLVVRPKAQVWLEVRYDDGPIGEGISVPNITLITATENRPDIEGSYGNICAVNYAIDFVHPVTGGANPYKVAGLYRKVINPEDTFTAILPHTLVATGTDAEGGTIHQPPSLRALVNADGNPTVAFSNFLNSNIVDLSVDFYAEKYVNVDGVRTRDGVDKVPVPFVYSDRIIDGDGKEITGLGRILYADIRMTVLSDEGAKLLRGEAADAGEVIKTYGTIFSRRVPILSRY